MSAREVELSGGAPWGFRMHGGADQNQPLRISRVNPGRKASLSGIREGDVITSINGKATKDMSNSDAHAMLRSAGPVLRLGLNEDREMSPRRRSIGKTTELKRPSQLISEINSGRATPQAPVYATIRPATSNNKLSSPIRSLNSPLNSTPLIKSVSPEPLKFHPTNPFYSTLPNYTSTSKLPIPNGKPSNTPTHRSTKLTDPFKNEHDLKLSSFFSKKIDSGPISVHNISYEPQVSNSYDTPTKCSSSDKYSSFSDSPMLSECRKNNDIKDNINPFDLKNNDIKYNLTCSDEKINSKSMNGSTLNYSKSDGDFRLNEDVIKHSTISEKKISEVEEIKTIRKITLNGSSENRNHQNGGLNYYDEKTSKFNTDTSNTNSPSERNISVTTKNNDVLKNNIEKSENIKREFCHNISIYKPPEDIRFEDDHTSEVLSSKPPVKSPNTSSNATTPTNKHEEKKNCAVETSESTSELVSEKLSEEESLTESCSPNTDKSSKTIEKEENKEIIVSQKYIVETPDQIFKVKPKLDNNVKSKSCDNDDSPTITEITDDSYEKNDKKWSVTESTGVIISSEEPNIEWENVNELKISESELIKGISSSNTIPLNIAHCQQTMSLSPEEELSLRNYLETLNLSSNQSNISSGDIKTEIEHIINREVKYRLRKKGLTDDTSFTRTGPSRSLAVIDEEGSGDSSRTSRRQSYLSDKKSDNEELEDDVFDKNLSQAASKHLIPQKCIKVDAKIKEPEISEARGDWSVKTVEKITGAELVYLTDSSSSTSSIYDANDEDIKDDDIDVTVRITTPTIEVTDTEKLLSSSYIAENINSKPTQANGIDKSTTLLTYDNDKERKNQNYDEIEKETAVSHEIIILNTDDIETDLFVKDIVDSGPLKEAPQSEEFHEKNENILKSTQKSKENIDQYDLEIKVLKCELNDAINNLIKEVTSDSENNDSPKDMITRQDSSSSLDSSQCTAKYNPTYSSLNDISNILHDDISENVHKDSSLSHVKDVLQSVSITEAMKLVSIIKKNPISLKDICLKKISSFPFGHKILEELANVSEKLQSSVLTSSCKKERTLHILDKEILQNKELTNPNKKSNHSLQNKDSTSTLTDKNNAPPILPRKSSLKKGQDEQSKQSEQPPKEVLYECLSPSQKTLMEKTNTIIEPDDMIQKSNKDLENSSSFTVSKQHNMSKNQSIGDLTLKSQTGSRLLALLLDSSHPNKLTSTSLNDHHFKQVTNAKYNQRELFSKRALEEIDSANFSDGSTTAKTSSFFSSNHFKPIPPPKPRNFSRYFCESDESSDIRENFQTMQKGKKYFHFSTGNLNKEIESDISSIQNMHRHCSDLRDINKKGSAPRRPSLPKDLCEQQMEYICRKEKEIDEEIRRLEQEKIRNSRNKGPRAPMITDKDSNYSDASSYKSNTFVNKGNIFPSLHNYGHTEKNRISSLFSSSQEELLREKMYSEYVNQMAEREQRKQHKVIKVTKTSDNNISKSMPVLENLDSKVNNRIEEEFITKARERWYKLGIRDPESEDERENGKNVYREPKIIEHKIKVIEAGEEKDVRKLPSHIQEFVKFTVSDKDNDKGDTGESDIRQPSTHVVVFCAVFILVISVGKFILRLLRNK